MRADDLGALQSELALSFSYGCARCESFNGQQASQHQPSTLSDSFTPIIPLLSSALFGVALLETSESFLNFANSQEAEVHKLHFRTLNAHPISFSNVSSFESPTHTTS